jgi:septal ring factor EnvC (AmiA/AmiB activator)
MKPRDRSLHRILILAGLVITSMAPAWSQTQEERALAAVRERIEGLERRLTRQHANREREYAQLRRIEVDSAAATAALRKVRADLARNQGRSRELAAESERAHSRLSGERVALARQVRMSFLTGRQETIKLLLNQEAPAQLGRMLAYYDYHNKARATRIENVNRELVTLAELATATRRVTAELGDLEQQQQGQLEELERLRTERQTAVSGLDATIETSEEEIARLRSEASRLGELVRELEALLADFPVDSQEPFSATKGTLPWPVAGSLLNAFGDRRAGAQIAWNGLQLSAAAGTPVRSIYHGRVVYSDWLPGLGLLLIVDHGEGFMSLYGYNEALLKESGDWVAPGEVIAQVGDSGGQSETALYFEIRQDGEPTDPRRWLNGDPPRRR